MNFFSKVIGGYSGLFNVFPFFFPHFTFFYHFLVVT